jgi:hypothetical protein
MCGQMDRWQQDAKFLAVPNLGKTAIADLDGSYRVENTSDELPTICELCVADAGVLPAGEEWYRHGPSAQRE